MQWVAYYNDNTLLSQYNEDGSENRYDDIQRDKLSAFAIFSEDKEPKLIFVVHLESDRKLVYRRRVQIKTGVGQVAVLLAGWRQKIGDQNVESLNWIFPDGHVESTSKFIENHPWFYSPVFREAEEI